MTPTLLVVAGLGLIGGFLACIEPGMTKRIVSIGSAITSVSSVGTFIHLVHVYNSRPISLVIATGNPLAGLGLWSEFVYVLSLLTILGAAWGSKKALIPLAVSGGLMLTYLTITITFWA